MTTFDHALLTRMIRAGQGLEPADLVVRDVRLLDVVTGAITPTDVAVVAGRIVGTHGNYEGKRVVDGRGRYCVPGFIDAHLHIESSLVTPFEFDRNVLPHGVTTAICDPHEIANVIGQAGIAYFTESALRTVMDIRVNLSSCVPATPFETSGATLELAALQPFSDHPKVIGLAEVMNFPGVLAGDPGMIAKLAAFQSGHIDGHAPLVSGLALNGYLAAGIRTDHEATTAAEAREKLAKGMSILIREGSVSKDLAALAEILDENTSSFVALCTDDRNPLDIHEGGHLDGMIRELIARGCPRHHVYRAASWSAARIFGLRDRGLVAPGWRADFALVDDLDACTVTDVVCGGRLVEPALFDARETIPPVGLGSVRIRPVSAADFAVKSNGGDRPTPVIGVRSGRIITDRLEAVLPVAGGVVLPDPDQDVIKVAVVERHGRTGTIGLGFVGGFGLRRGAIASSVGHDSHNITVVGLSDADMAAAVTRLAEIGGGFAVVDDGKILAELALPVAGLMSDQPFDTVRQGLVDLRAAAKSLGCTLAEPFLQVAFLALPVIPHLKMTDRGLFDVDAFAFVDD